MATAAHTQARPGLRRHQVDFDPVWVGTSPYDLTSVTLTVYIKPSAATPDDDPSVTVITATPSAAGVITVTDAANGLATLTIAATVIPDPATLFWHLDAVDEGGAVGTIAYGPIYVEATGSD